MKNKTSIKLMATTVLASTLLLGACGNKKENTASDNPSKTTQASSSSKANSSNKESKTQASTSTTTSEKAKASSEQASSPTTQGQEDNRAAQTPQAPHQQTSQSQSNPASQSAYDSATDRKLQDKQAEHNKRYKGVLTMVDKDFSAAAGNWKGANGETITVSSGGQFTVESADGKKENYSIQSYSYTLDDGKYNAEVGGGRVIQITTGADGAVSSVVLIQP